MAVYTSVKRYRDCTKAQLVELAEVLEEQRDNALARAASRALSLTRVRGLHQPEIRWQHHPEAEWSYDNPEDAAEQDKAEGGDGSNVTTFTICRHCAAIEIWMAMENQDDGWGYRESLWPCATVRALEGEDTDG